MRVVHTIHLAAWMLLVQAAIGSLYAQRPSDLAPGRRVRITAPEAGLTQSLATVAALAPDSLVVDHVQRPGSSPSAAGDAVRLAIPLRQVTQLEVSIGRRHTYDGARIGALAGIAGGAAWGIAKPLHCRWPTEWLFSVGAVECIGAAGGEVGWVLVHAMLGGAAGAIAGGAVGWLVRTESWRSVAPDRLRAVATPLPGGRLGLGASLAF